MPPIIAIDAKRAFFNSTGLGNYSRDLLRGLGAASFDAHWLMYSPRQVAHQPEWLPSKAEIISPHGVQRLAPSWWRRTQPARDARARGAQIYHGISNELPQQLPAKGLQTLATIHDLIPITHPHLFDPINRKIYTRKMEHAMRVADHLVAVSQYTKKLIATHTGRPETDITVISPTVHSDFWQTDLPAGPRQKKEPYFLMVGRWERRKNIESAMLALRELPAESCSLVLVGAPSSHVKSLRALANETGIADRVEWVENASLAELRAWYRHAAGLLYLSHTEGFGIPILEAFLSGTEVITNREGVFSEAGGLEARYVDVTNPPEIALQMEDLLKVGTNPEKIGAAQMRIREQFHPTAFVQKHVELYQSLIARAQ